MRLIALVGLCGSGKSEAAQHLLKKGYHYIRFGQVTIDDLNRRGLPINENNERAVRESLRNKYGKTAYAKLNLPKIEAACGDVVIDGLYSWEEYLLLKQKFGTGLVLICTFAGKDIRHKRLSARAERPLSGEEMDSRDAAEIEKLNKAGPIAVADYMIVNNGSVAQLHKQLDRILGEINEPG
ncbi:MAG: AAA family ATPase [archaeon]